MRDVRDELAALALRLLQRVRHRVEGACQLADLARAVVVHPGVEIALGKGARSGRHFADGARLAHTHPRRGDEGEQQHDDARHQEHGEKRAPHRRQPTCLGHGEHRADRPNVGLDRHADNEALALVDAAERRARAVTLAGERSLHHVGRHGEHMVDQIFVRRQQDAALGAAHEEVHVGHRRGNARHLAHIAHIAARGVGRDQPRDNACLLRHLVAALIRRVGVAEREERRAEQRERQHDDARGQGEILPVDRPELLRKFPSLALHYFFTSNL